MKITCKYRMFIYSVILARETRIPPILAHIGIDLSLLLLPLPLQYIPRAVLDGIFLYLALTALDSSQMFERIRLFFTEQVRSTYSEL